MHHIKRCIRDPSQAATDSSRLSLDARPRNVTASCRRSAVDRRNRETADHINRTGSSSLMVLIPFYPPSRPLLPVLHAFSLPLSPLPSSTAFRPPLSPLPPELVPPFFPSFPLYPPSSLSHISLPPGLNYSPLPSLPFPLFSPPQSSPFPPLSPRTPPSVLPATGFPCHCLFPPFFHRLPRLRILFLLLSPLPTLAVPSCPFLFLYLLSLHLPLFAPQRDPPRPPRPLPRRDPSFFPPFPTNGHILFTAPPLPLLWPLPTFYSPLTPNFTPHPSPAPHESVSFFQVLDKHRTIMDL